MKYMLYVCVCPSLGPAFYQDWLVIILIVIVIKPHHEIHEFIHSKLKAPQQHGTRQACSNLRLTLDTSHDYMYSFVSATRKNMSSWRQLQTTTSNGNSNN